MFAQDRGNRDKILLVVFLAPTNEAGTEISTTTYDDCGALFWAVTGL